MVEKEELVRVESTSRSTRSAGSNGGSATEASPPTTKIAERLTLAVEVAVIDKNMSPGLVPLAQHYEKLKKHLRSLLSSAKTYQQHSIQIQKSRNEVSLQLLEERANKRLCWKVMMVVLASIISLLFLASIYRDCLTLSSCCFDLRFSSLYKT